MLPGLAWVPLGGGDASAGCCSLAICMYYALKKRQFHNVSRPDPSAFTLYLLFPVDSTTSPDLDGDLVGSVGTPRHQWPTVKVVGSAT